MPFRGDAQPHPLQIQAKEECFVLNDNLIILGVSETRLNGEIKGIWHKYYEQDKEGCVGKGVAFYIIEVIESNKLENIRGMNPLPPDRIIMGGNNRPG